MKKKAAGPWLRRNQLPSRAPSSRVPPYKPPRKEFKVTAKEKEKTSPEVIDVQDSEERQDANKDDEESQTETQFGLVWERYEGPPAETTDTSKDKQSRLPFHRRCITDGACHRIQRYSGACPTRNGGLGLLPVPLRKCVLKLALKKNRFPHITNRISTR